MTILGKRALFETIKTIDSATFTGAYQAVGGPLLHPAVLFKIVNNSNALVTISYDGVNDMDILPAGSFVLYDVGSDAQSTAKDVRLYLAQGTQVFVKGAAGVGLVYLVVMYQGG